MTYDTIIDCARERHLQLGVDARADGVELAAIRDGEPADTLRLNVAEADLLRETLADALRAPPEVTPDE